MEKQYKEVLENLGGPDSDLAKEINFTSTFIVPQPVCGETTNFLTHIFCDQMDGFTFNPTLLKRDSINLTSLKKIIKYKFNKR